MTNPGAGTAARVLVDVCRAEAARRGAAIPLLARVVEDHEMLDGRLGAATTWSRPNHYVPDSLDAGYHSYRGGMFSE